MESLQFAVDVTIANISRQEVSLFFEQRKMGSQRCSSQQTFGLSKLNIIKWAVFSFIPYICTMYIPKTILDLMNNKSGKKQVWDIVGDHSRR